LVASENSSFFLSVPQTYQESLIFGKVKIYAMFIHFVQKQWYEQSNLADKRSIDEKQNTKNCSTVFNHEHIFRPVSYFLQYLRSTFFFALFQN